MELDQATYEQIERAEQDLNAFINKRSRAKAQANAEEELWKASERAYFARKEEERRQRWIEYHEYLADCHEQQGKQLAAQHRAKAKALRKNGG